jgi:hypothetical protein
MSLRDFPFDQQTARVELVSSQNFATMDGTVGIPSDGNKTYRLRQVGGATGTGLNLMTWSGEIVEWDLHGIAAQFVSNDGKAVVGGAMTRLSLVFVISRQTSYYFWKVILPLYLVTALSFTAFHFDTEDLVNRSALTSSYFLAAFAMLYVVGDSLPKTHFLTRVDKLIVSTILTISMSGLLSRAIYSVHVGQGKVMAGKWNLRVEIILLVLYTVSNLRVFGPPWLKMRKNIAKLEQAEQAPLLSDGAYQQSPLGNMLAPDGIGIESEERALPLVPSGARYYSLDYLLGLTRRAKGAS